MADILARTFAVKKVHSFLNLAHWSHVPRVAGILTRLCVVKQVKLFWQATYLFLERRRASRAKSILQRESRSEGKHYRFK